MVRGTRVSISLCPRPTASMCCNRATLSRPFPSSLSSETSFSCKSAYCFNLCFRPRVLACTATSVIFSLPMVSASSSGRVAAISINSSMNLLPFESRRKRCEGKLYRGRIVRRLAAATAPLMMQLFFPPPCAALYNEVQQHTLPPSNLYRSFNS